MNNPLHLIDFRAVVKHSYYGAKDEEGIHCEKTDRRFPNWQVGCAGILTRYVIPILESGASLREIIVAHDMGKAYRTGIYADYKGQKSKKDENKSPIEIDQYEKAMVWAKSFFSFLGSLQIGVKDVEADDVMAWIHQRVKGPKHIHTVDQDMLQLVDDDTIVSLKGAPHYGSDGVYPEGHELEGLPYSLTSFAKSIIGDTSDNYGGVKGMGVAKIHHLMKEFGIDGLEQLQEVVRSGNTDLLKDAAVESGDKVLYKLLENYSDWKQGWRLANLNPDLCWKPRLNKLVKPTLHKRVPNAQKLRNSLIEIGCGDLWHYFEPMMPSPLAVTPENWPELREALFAEILAGDLMSFDYESSDKEPVARFRMASASGGRYVDMLSQELAGASFQFGRHLENVVYIAVDHADQENNLPKAVIAEILQFAQDKGVQLVAHNALFEGVVSQTNLGMRLTNVQDTRMMQRFYDENTEAGLKFLSLNYLGYEQTSFEDTLAAGSGGKGVKMMCELTSAEVFQYGTDDSLVTGHLHDLLKLLLQLDGQWDFYSQWAVRPTEVLQRAYIDGVDMNWALQKRLHQRDLKAIEEGKIELRKILLKNVTGNITDGCKSLIEAERDYIYRSAKKKAEGDADVASTKLGEWRKKLETACQYIPYREESVMPAFAFTPLQVSAAAKKIGLPEVEKFTQKALADWLVACGAEGFEDEWELTAPQKELIKGVTKAAAAGCLKMSELRKKVEEKPDNLAAQSKLEDADMWFEKVGEIVQRLACIEPRIVEYGDPLNVGSPQQMQQLLYCKIGMPVRLRGKNVGKGRLAVGIGEAGPSTDEQAILTAFANDIKTDCWQKDALKVLLKVKSATTRCSLYHDKYPLWRHRDGKIHPGITDYGTDTGRPTGSAPNILQVSKKDKVMRSMFIPPSRDHVCVAIDFNGQEIRLMANLARDLVMLSVYDPKDEKDLHSMTASGIAKMSYPEFVVAYNDEDHPKHALTQALRKLAKGVNFGMAYGAGPGTLSRNLIVPVEEAKKLLEDTFNLYTRIQPWQEETALFMEKYGYTETAFGTKRHANADIFSKDKGKVGRQHRQGTNATIQGTAAEMLRIVLTQVAASGMLDRIRMVFFAPIYDEIVAWVHKDDVYDYCHEMGGYMEASTPPGHVVRQVPEYSIGADWGRVHELKRDISAEKVSAAVQKALDEAVDIWEVDLLEEFDPILKPIFTEMDEDEEVECDVVD